MLQVPACSNDFLVMSKLAKMEASLQTLYEQIKEVWLHMEVFDECSAPLFYTLFLLLLHYSNLLSSFIGVRLLISLQGECLSLPFLFLVHDFVEQARAIWPTLIIYEGGNLLSQLLSNLTVAQKEAVLK